MSDGRGALNGEQLERLARYFDEEVTFSKHIGAKVEEVEPGRSVISIDVDDVHLLGPVNEGCISCQSEVLHRTRRTATAEAKVHDSEGNLVALGTGAFRVFESRGNAIV